MADDNKPPNYDDAGHAPPFTTPPQHPHFQAPGMSPYPPPSQQPYAGPPANGTPYYPPQQQAGYNAGNVTVVGAYPPPPGQHLQQPQVIVVNSQAAVAPTADVPMSGAIALACVAFWCFGWLFGGIAFVLAIVGQNSAAVGDKSGAIRMRNASYGVSIAGIVIGIIVIAVAIGVSVSAAKAVSQSYYYSSQYCYYDAYGYRKCI